jgi:AcrR family transcriptional regulator
MRRTPLQERSNETVHRILDAGSSLLARIPLEQVTTNRIAEEAGLSVGGLYRFFPDKQAIIDAIAVSRMEQFRGRLEQEFSSGLPEDGPQFLGKVIDLYIDFLDAQPDFRTIALGKHVSGWTYEQQAGPGGLVGSFLLQQFAMPGMEELELKLRIVVEAGERLISFAYKQPTREARAEVIEEMKKLLSGYLFL